MTASVGGPLDGVVTLTASSPPPGVRVAATWHEHDERQWLCVERNDEADALATANAWIDLIADGFAPEIDD